MLGLMLGLVVNMPSQLALGLMLVLVLATISMPSRYVLGLVVGLVTIIMPGQYVLGMVTIITPSL